jgi:hypothetical protein
MGNAAAAGGGIENGAGATLTITRSSVILNRAIGRGGGIDNRGTLTIARSTVSRNRVADEMSEAWGGGIANVGHVSMTDSTISSNIVVGQNGGLGGGIANGSVVDELGGVLVMIASTVTRNRVGDELWSGRGGGIHAYSPAGAPPGPTVIVGASIVAGNRVSDAQSSTAPDCAGSFETAGDNVIGVRQGCSGFTHLVDGDQVGTLAHPILPRLASLADNGGPTMTHALLAGSPAIDRAGPAPCTTPRDQRGVGRPKRARCDIGSFELR